ncbi:HNH endonuclease [Sporosarcina sp. A2]|uniref:HNH endonuclease n=1 Tax=Sporosarcina sp. A2 TaxID=3393449 RepID=UPI003D7A531D
MQSYIVMQGRTYYEEKELGILWSQQQDSAGNIQHFWERMKEVNAGDRIFHYIKGDIVAISVAKTGYREESKPTTLDLPVTESDKGYLVEVDYHELEKPLAIEDSFNEILPLLPIKYSPFQENANGNQGYLYPCNEELTIKLVELIGDLNIYEIDEEQLEFVMGTVRKTEHDFLTPILAETEAEAKTKVRLGHQRFRIDLMPLWHDKCALCDIALPELLKASYAKPWKDSTNNERVEPNNGILLCRNHDALYTNGLIAFDGQGKIHISSRIPEEDYNKYGLYGKMRITRNETNKPYLKWHKKHVFNE